MYGGGVYTLWGLCDVPSVKVPRTARWSLDGLEAVKCPCVDRTWTLTLATGERGSWRFTAGWSPPGFDRAFEQDGKLVVEFWLGDSEEEEEEEEVGDTGGNVQIEGCDPFANHINPFD